MKLSPNYLRQKHKRFFYNGYEIHQERNTLRFTFKFAIDPDIVFSPKVVVMNTDANMISGLGHEILNNLAFHLGMMEIPSYWKATCSPEIIIRAGELDSYQLSWWKDLLVKGQSEFFYVNGIDFTEPDFVTFQVQADSSPMVSRYNGAPKNSGKILVPIGGGKDSVVTCEVLKNSNRNVTCWALNPTPAIMNIIGASETSTPIIATRVIDEQLLKLNQQGYLNGHTPFSAYLAFLSAVCSVIFGYDAIAVSNERSSNEGNVIYKGIEINHQYSKSADFENRFRSYASRYLATNSNYFSFLRPLYEIQIAQLFLQFPKYQSIFRSCNKGQKTNSWCHKCAKCLFAFAILYPFIEDEELTKDVFSESLFDNEELTEIALSLLGYREVKPFECVGSREETKAAFYLCLKKARRKVGPLPKLLKNVEAKVFAHEVNMEERTRAILNSWNDMHTIPSDLEALLKQELNV